MLKTGAFRGELREKVRIRDMRGQALFDNVCKHLPLTLEAEGIPFRYRTDEVRSGGFFGGSSSPCMIVSHPNPPSSFFEIVFLVNDNVISFHVIGESEQNTKANKKAAYEQEGKWIRAAMVSPDEFLLDQEKAWQADVLDAFASMFEQ